MLKLVYVLLSLDVVGLVLVGTQRALIPGLILIGVVDALVMAILIAAVRSERILRSVG